MPERSVASNVRQAAVAGRFYPQDANELRRDVAKHLSLPTADTGRPKALVVPHAGYMYSGAVAGAAYALLGPAAARIRRVVLLGPSHRLAFRGLALPAADAFATPLGRVGVDPAGRMALVGDEAALVSDRAHDFEHSLEVQLPFLQTVLEEFAVVPLLAGQAAPELVAAVLERVWGGPETMLVISTDLSHYHDDATAKRLDAATSARILALEGRLASEDACGFVGLNGFLLAAARRRLAPRELARCTSGDVTGDYSRVVGYGAYAFYEQLGPND